MSLSEPIPLIQPEQRRTTLDALSFRGEPARSLYIHVPFCFHKCHYCDFYSIVDTRGRQEAFIDALRLELKALSRHADPSRGLNTIFIGGGTPTLLPPELWRPLLDALRDCFNLDPIDRGEGEFTVECNPETATGDLMATLAAGGVNRLSVGAQSFNTRHLQTLERWHDPDNVARALALAAEAGITRRSVDLINAIPGQTLDDAQRDLRTALALDPPVEHISCYSLTYEPNTAMTRRMERGEFQPIDEDDDAAMQMMALQTLRDAGFERYEVSNFARRGGDEDATRAQSAHNLVYWRLGAYLAAGPSASGHVLAVDPSTGLPTGARWKNTPRLSEWMRTVADSGGYAPIIDFEPPDAARTLAERLMMGTRLSEGVELASALDHAERLGVADDLDRAIARERDAGRLSIVDGSARPTDSGFLHADHIAARLMRAVQR